MLIYSKLHEKNHLVNNVQVTISVTLQYFAWNGGNKLHKLYWMKIWQVNSSVKIQSLSPSHVRKLSSFFLQLKQSLLTVELNTFTTKQRKNSLRFWCGFLAKCFWVVEKLYARNYCAWPWYKLLCPKYRETKLKSTKNGIS